MRPDESPWYERNTTLVVCTTALLFGGVLLARLFLGSGPHAVMVLFVFPVALMALTWGLRGGLGGAGLTVLLMVVPELLDDGNLEVLGWVSRLSAVGLLGVLLGAAQDRSRAHQAWELEQRMARAALQREADRMAAAAEISDSLIQGMASAKWMIEAGRHDAGAEILTDTIERAQTLVAGLLDRRVSRVLVTEPETPA
jgi:glucose-6-phosphate-specific signal transduction histidine kinase